MSSLKNERLLELLIDQATIGLTGQEKVELLNLLVEEGVEDDWSFDQTAAVLDLAMTKQEEMTLLPKHIRSQVIDQADQVIPSAGTRENEPFVETAGRGQQEMQRSAFGRREAIAWLATAAAILLAAYAWFSRPTTVDPIDRTALIAQASSTDFDEFVGRSDVFEVAMEPGNDPTGADASAKVFWDRKTKQGFIKISGLKSNQPTEEQYQLWVIDRVRGIEDRPNAGVFDISKQGEAVFEFRSDLEVFEAQGFAITVEKPGGVNKSDLSRIALANLGG